MEIHKKFIRNIIVSLAMFSSIIGQSASFVRLLSVHTAINAAPPSPLCIPPKTHAPLCLVGSSFHISFCHTVNSCKIIIINEFSFLKINNIKMNISYFATIAHCLINFNNAIFPTDLSLPLLLSLIHLNT